MNLTKKAIGKMSGADVDVVDFWHESSAAKFLCQMSWQQDAEKRRIECAAKF